MTVDVKFLFMKCIVHYSPPSGDVEFFEELDGVLLVGRDPGPNGLKLQPEDRTISALAVEITKLKNQVGIKSTNRHEHISLIRDNGNSKLPSGMEIRIDTSFELLIPGESYKHKISVDITGVTSQTKPEGLTVTPFTHDVSIPEERLPTMIALCAYIFYPDDYDNKPMSSDLIAKVLKRKDPASKNLTKRAVENKVQRERDKWDLASKEDLASFYTERNLVTKKMVDDLLS